MRPIARHAALVAFVVMLGSRVAPAADPVPAPGEPAVLSIRVEGLRNDNGRVKALVYRTADGFMRDETKAVARAESAIKDKSAVLEFPALPAGSYAVECFHDENGNGKLDTNWIGIPREGVGASNNAKGRMENAGFLDYRVPVASEVPMIEAVLVEVPNPRHPFGARGVGEVPIVPPMAAIANAIRSATGLRMPDLPMSPPKVRAAFDAAG